MRRFILSALLTPPPGQVARCANPTPTATAEVTRALLVAMDAWADRGVEPPPSTYPNRALRVVLRGEFGRSFRVVWSKRAGPSWEY